MDKTWANFNKKNIGYLPLNANDVQKIVKQSIPSDIGWDSRLGNLLASLIFPSYTSIVFRKKYNIDLIPVSRLQFIETTVVSYYVLRLVFEEYDTTDAKDKRLTLSFLPRIYELLISCICSEKILNESTDIVRKIMDERLDIYKNHNIGIDNLSDMCDIYLSIIKHNMSSDGYVKFSNDPLIIMDIFKEAELARQVRVVLDSILEISKGTMISSAIYFKKAPMDSEEVRKIFISDTINYDRYCGTLMAEAKTREKEAANKNSNRQTEKDISSSAKDKEHPNTSNLTKSSSQKKTFSIVPLVVFIGIYIATVLFLIGKASNAYNAGLEKGHEDGYTEGYNIGYDDGYILGIEEKSDLDTEEIFKNGWIAGYSSCISDYEDYIPNIQN